MTYILLITLYSLDFVRLCENIKTIPEKNYNKIQFLDPVDRYKCAKLLLRE